MLVPAVQPKRSPRLRLQHPVDGTFGVRRIVIHNIGEQGIQIEHHERIAPGTTDVLTFHLPVSPRPIRLTGRVVWCRQAKQKNVVAQWPYRCGLKFEGVAAISLDTLARLMEDEYAVPIRTNVAPFEPPIDDLPRASWVPTPPIPLDECVALVRSAEAELRRRSPELIQRLAQAAQRHSPAEGTYEEAVWAIVGYLRCALEPRVVRMVREIYVE